MGHFPPHQERHEMPVLPADERLNFKEVELGYEDENIAQQEASRCLECGCTAYFDCDLKKTFYRLSCRAKKLLRRVSGASGRFQTSFY